MSEDQRRQARRRKVLARSGLSEDQLSSALINDSVTEMLSQTEKSPRVRPASPVSGELDVSTVTAPSTSSVQLRMILWAVVGVFTGFILSPEVAFSLLNVFFLFVAIDGVAVALFRRAPSNEPTYASYPWFRFLKVVGHISTVFSDFCCFFTMFLLFRVARFGLSALADSQRTLKP